MEINQIKTLLAVAGEGSFRRAAKVLYVSPKAVSQQIERLEVETGTHLFKRYSNRIELTPEGTYFVKHMREIMDQINKTVYTTQHIKDPKSSLKLAYYSLFDSWLMDQNVLAFRRVYKHKFSLQMINLNMERLLSHLIMHEIDGGYFNNYGIYNILDRTAYNFVDIWSDEMVIYMSKQNPLAHKSKLKEKDLLGEDLLYYSNDKSDYMRKNFLSTIKENRGKLHI